MLRTFIAVGVLGALLFGSVILLPIRVAAQENATVDPKSPEKTSVNWTDLPKVEDDTVWLFSGDKLEHWEVTDKSYFDKHGLVRWEDQVLTLLRGQPGTGVTAKFEVPRNNYEISFQARRTAGMDFFCGLTFPFDDQQGTLILGGWGGGAVGISNVNNFSAIENASSRHFEFEQDRWYNVRFRVMQEELELWIDEASVFQLDTEDKTFSIWWEQKPMAPLGFATWNTSAQLKEVKLRAIAPKNSE